MLTGILGTRLLFWVGATVPTPPSSEVIDAVSQVEVTQDETAGNGFQVQLSLAPDEAGDYRTLSDGALALGNRVWIAVLLGVTPEALIDGIITHQQVTPAPEGGGATLTVTGRDVTVMLDLEEKTAKYENQPDFVIVTQILARYAQYGLVPAVTPTTDVPIVLQRTPWQTDTDLQFIRRLAQRNGYVFHVDPTTIGVNTAYFGPPVRAAAPQPALTVGMGPDANVASLHFTVDALAPVKAEVRILEPLSKTVIPIPSVPSTRLPPFTMNPVPARRTVVQRNAAKWNPAQAANASASAVSLAPEAVSAEGEVDFERYGGVLRARRSVGVRGVGLDMSGQYWIRRVTHKIDRAGGYTQSFTLGREGTKSLLPAVVP